MAVERVDLSVSMALERMAPAPVASVVQGQSLPEEGKGKGKDKKDKDDKDKDRDKDKLRRHPPHPEEPTSNPGEADDDPPRHRIDSLA
jgi:hypothetical protein